MGQRRCGAGLGVDRPPIAWGEHVAWFTAALAAGEPVIYIAERADEAVGQVRFNRRGHGLAEVDLSVADRVRAGGIGTIVLQLGCDMDRQGFDGAMRARIRADNTASIRVFEKAGFTMIAEEREGAYPIVLLELPPSDPERDV